MDDGFGRFPYSFVMIARMNLLNLYLNYVYLMQNHLFCKKYLKKKLLYGSNIFVFGRVVRYGSQCD